METTITIPSTVTPEQVAESRNTFVSALSTTYGAGRIYAADLVAFFDSLGFGTAWITMAHDHKGADGDAMRTERDTLYTALKAAGHSNPSVKWKQIKGYAAELVRAESGEAEGEAAEGEAEGSGKKSTRSPQLRLVEDLVALHKMCKREAKTLTEQQRKAALHIAAALSDLGVDLNSL
jgi:hypothetical protein